MSGEQSVRVRMPKKLEFLRYPKQFKVLKGGRGSTKSWSVAQQLLLDGKEQPLRILCAREIQNSIAESVHQLLKDQIKRLELDYFYSDTRDKIVGRNGTKFVYTGLQQHTIYSIKSFEGIDRCWVEEGQSVSKRSWDILLPTIRKDGSEVWVTFNPDLESDDTYKRFVINPPPDCICVDMNWRDNPWWNKEMEAARLHCFETDPDNYDNIWEGKCRPAVEGAIFFKEMQRAEEEGRICNVPYDPLLKVHLISDLGNLDQMFTIFAQKHSSEIRVIKAVQGGYRSIPEYASQFATYKYNWGKWWLPHDGFSISRQTGLCDADILRRMGWNVPERFEITEKSVEAGIRAARVIAPRCYIDRVNADPLVEALKRYQRRTNAKTDSESSPMPNRYAHGGDAFRYLAVNERSMMNEDDRTRIPECPWGDSALDPIIGY